MDLAIRVANAVATNNVVELQALADEGYMLNKAPAGARTMAFPSKLEITERGVKAEHTGTPTPFTMIVTANGVVHVAVNGMDVHVWAEA